MSTVTTVTHAEAGEALRANEEAHHAWQRTILEGGDSAALVEAARECEARYRELYDLVMRLVGEDGAHE